MLINMPLFRNLLAEKGIETTPEQAEELYKSAKKVMRLAKKMSTEDLWAMLEADGFSEKEKSDFVMLYQHAKEI